ncbi:MAG TPA: isochorismatase family protein [Burkholderiaceae bacterium]|nr:isochorismatase family protein [Burkholderiaceae bacterium]
MTSTPWEAYLTPADRQILERGRWAQDMNPGTRPAIVSIDVQNYMVGRRGEADADFPYSCGPVGWEAVDAAKPLLAAARRKGVPIVYTRFALDPAGGEGGTFARKVGMGKGENAFVEGTFGSQFVEEIGPQPGDLVITKKKMSAFFGTPLQAYLTDRGIDTVILIGGSTSNCVRATAVDAAQMNYRVLIPAEAVFDRLPLSHAVSLFDMQRSCANVAPTARIVEYLEGLPAAV